MDAKHGPSGLEFKQSTNGEKAEQFFCERCKLSMKLDEMIEHEDWHLAMDLQTQEEAGSSSTAPPPQPASNPFRSDPDKAGISSGGKADLPPDYGPPSYPPPSQSSYQQPHREHTNKVIQAARVRARDEVCAIDISL
jgi:hypothetical protein